MRSNDKKTDPFALWAWQVRVLQKSHIPRNVDQVEQLARDLGISPAIIAGRTRHETRDHRLFGTLFREKVDREALGWEK